jgi:tetratricopeptide (TPR) repeat protein
MNINLLNTLKQITTQYGTLVLNDSKRVNGLLNDLAPRESKAEKKAFITCLMNGFHTELQNTAEDRPLCKNRLAQRLHDDEGLDLALCGNTLDLLEGALFGEAPPKNVCRNCGKELQSEWKICPYCSAAVTEPEAVPVPAPSPQAVPVPQPVIQAESTQPEPVIEAVPQAAVVVPQAAPSPAPVVLKKHTKRNVLIAAGVVVVIVLIIFVTLNNQQSYTPTSTSTSNSETAPSHTSIAYSLAHQQMDYAGAIAEYTKAIELDSSNASAYNNHAFFSFYLGAYDDALNDINTALSISQNASYYDTRGTIYRALSQYDNAIADYNKAIQLNSSRSTYLENRAWAYFWRDGNQNQYDKDHAQAVSIDKDGVAEAIRDIAINTMCSGDYDSAVQRFDMALQYTPDDQDIQKLKTLAAERKQLGTTFSLAGTKWLHNFNYNDSSFRAILEFQPNGKLIYTSLLNLAESPGTWSQDKSEVTMSINNFSTSIGIIESASIIKGNAKNLDGDTWQFEWRR